jgi:hypothetical protein
MGTRTRTRVAFDGHDPHTDAFYSLKALYWLRQTNQGFHGPLLRHIKAQDALRGQCNEETERCLEEFYWLRLTNQGPRHSAYYKAQDGDTTRAHTATELADESGSAEILHVFTFSERHHCITIVLAASGLLPRGSRMRRCSSARPGRSQPT